MDSVTSRNNSATPSAHPVRWHTEVLINGTWYRSDDTVDTAGAFRVLNSDFLDAKGKRLPVRVVMVCAGIEPC